MVGGNFLCDDNISNQLRIEHLYHEIYSKQTVPCCHYFRDLNALRVIEYYFYLKAMQKKRKNRKKNVRKQYFVGKNAEKNKQNAIDLCIQILFWQMEETHFLNETKQKKKKRKKFRDDRLCKFELIDVHKLESLVHETLIMLGINCKKLEYEKKAFLKKYPHYKVCHNLNDEKEQKSEDEEDECDEYLEDSEDAHEDDEDYLIDDDVVKESKTKKKKNSRRRSLRSAQKNKKKKRVSNKRKKKKKNENAKHQCFKCKEQSAVRHMILFVCCDTYYHLRCAGYTTARTQTAIQQHIDNGTINKQCPVCIKKGKRTQA